MRVPGIDDVDPTTRAARRSLIAAVAIIGAVVNGPAPDDPPELVRAVIKAIVTCHDICFDEQARQPGVDVEVDAFHVTATALWVATSGYCESPHDDLARVHPHSAAGTTYLAFGFACAACEAAGHFASVMTESEALFLDTSSAVDVLRRLDRGQP